MLQKLKLNEVTPELLVETESGLADFKRLKPNNWRDYLQLFIDEIKSTGATEMLPIGRGLESQGAYELFKDGKSLHAVIRIQNGGLQMPVNRYDGLMPFYREIVYELPGDPPHDFDVKNSWIITNGVRINTMPQVLRLPELVNEMGPVNDHLPEWEGWVDYSGIIRQQMNGHLAAQGQLFVDNHPGNEGFYCIDSGQYIPVVFDPGSTPMYRYPATVPPGSSHDRNRFQRILQHERDGCAAWMDRSLWDEMRDEITADALRLYEGKPTHYAARMETIDTQVPVEALIETSRPLLRQKSSGALHR